MPLDPNAQARAVSRLGTYEAKGQMYREVPNLDTAPDGDTDTYYVAARLNADAPWLFDFGITRQLASGVAHDAFVLSFDEPTTHMSVVLSEQPLVSGGVPGLLDTSHCTEAGFHYFPVLPHDPIGANTAGHNLTGGARYLACVVYSWIDATGAKHRSPPSVPVMIDLDVAHNGFTFQAFCLSLSEKFDGEDVSFPISLEVYRTVANGTTFYFEQAVSNEKSVPLATITCGPLSDDKVIGKESLYTGGGVFADWQPPALRHCVAHNNRIWAISAERPTVLWVSKDTTSWPLVPGFPPQLTVRHEHGGPFVALAALDDKVIAFKESSIWAFVGDPPSDTGQGGDLRGPVLVSLEKGCIDPRSVCACPAGIVFRGRDTVHLLSRGLEVTPIGETVADALVKLATTTSAVHDHVHGLVLISGANSAGTVGTHLAWDYRTGAWVEWRFPGPTGTYGAVTQTACMAMRNGAPVYHFFQTTAFGGYLTDTDRRDGWTTASAEAAWCGFTVDTGWIALAGLAGYQRLRKVQLLATALSTPHAVTMKAYLNYYTASPLTKSWSEAEVAAAILGSREQLEWHIGAKCEAIRIEIEVPTPTVRSTSKEVRLEALTLEVGTKRGTMKLPAGARK